MTNENPRIKFSYFKQTLGKRFVAPHVLCLARIESDDFIKFGWSFCIPSRWETQFGKNLNESYYDPSIQRDLTEAEYNELIAQAELFPALEDSVSELEEENDGELIIAEARKDKAREDANKRLASIVYKKQSQKYEIKRLIKGDIFSKKTAREIAIARLRNMPITVKKNPAKHSNDLMLDELRMSADIPKQIADFAEISYQINKMFEVEKKDIQDAVWEAMEEEESTWNILASPIKEMWATDIGKATLIIGGICLAFLASVLMCGIL